MSDNVVSLHGAKQPHSPAPQRLAVEGVVNELERLLNLARAGELVGFAGVYRLNTRPIEYSFAGAVQGFGMIGGLECVKLRLAQDAVEHG